MDLCSRHALRASFPPRGLGRGLLPSPALMLLQKLVPRHSLAASARPSVLPPDPILLRGGSAGGRVIVTVFVPGEETCCLEISVRCRRPVWCRQGGSRTPPPCTSGCDPPTPPSPRRRSGRSWRSLWPRLAPRRPARTPEGGRPPRSCWGARRTRSVPSY